MLDTERKEAIDVFGGNVSVSNDQIESFDPEKFGITFRATIAKYIILFFLTGIGVILIGAPIYNLYATETLRIDTLNFLATYAGILGPFVGVISGYYFKDK